MSRIGPRDGVPLASGAAPDVPIIVRAPWVKAGLALVAVLIAANAAVAYRNSVRLRENERRVSSANEVVQALDGLLSTMKDAETGERGFLLTSDERYLAPYRDARAAAERQLAALDRLTADDPVQHARLPRLRTLVAEKLDELARTISLHDAAGFDAARREVLTHLGKNRMDEIRALVAAMQEDAQRTLEERRKIRELGYRTSVFTGVLAAVLGLAGLAAFAVVLWRHLEARRRTASALHEQREWFRTTLGSIGDAVIATDTGGRVTFLNSVAESLTGWSEAEARGQPLETIFRIVNEKTSEPAPNPVTRVLEHGKVVGLANHTVLLSRTGREWPIDDSAAPIRDEDGGISGVVLVFREVSALRREEETRLEQAERLADAEARVRSVVDNVVDGIITIDERARIQTFNRAAERLFGYEAAETVGRNLNMLMPAPYRDEHDGYIERYLRTGEARIIGVGREVEGRRKDGSTFPIELEVSEFRLEERRYFTGVVRDISERKRTEKQTYDLLFELKDADRRKDEFLAILAHELRGPLSPLVSALEIVAYDRGPEEVRRRALATMERQLTQMVRLVDDLLDVARITQGRLELRREPVDLAQALCDAVELCRPLAKSRSQCITTALPPAALVVDGDRVRLAQVFGNLLNNACRYSDPGARVFVTAAREGEGAVVTVKDEGLGIAPDQLSRVFELFVQADRASERSGEGMGIGLALVKRLVDLHGGQVEARSAGPGRGSEFVVRLPLLSETAARPRPAVTVAVSSPRRHRVLVVDDDEDSADTLAALLEVMGNDAKSTYDGYGAVEIAEGFRPELVLLDIGLPGLSGYETARRIRGKPWGREITLVALTGWGQPDDRRKSKEAGFDEHLVKPVDFDVLEGLLRSLPGQEGDDRGFSLEG